jgi:hypothetical protein
MTMAATYNGVAMTSVGVVHSGGVSSISGYVQLWRLIAPATGANTVAITVTGGTPTSLAGGSVSYTGVNQTTPLGTPVTGTAQTGSPSVAVTGTTAGNMVAGAAVNGGAFTSSNNTGRWQNNASSSTAAGNAAQADAAASGTVTMSWTVAADWWAAIAVELLADTGAVAATGTPFPVLTAPGLFRGPGSRFPQPWLGTGTESGGASYTQEISDPVGLTDTAAQVGSYAQTQTDPVGLTDTTWGPPSGLTATGVSPSQVDLSWSAMPGATGYDIERDGVVIATDVVGTSYSDTGLNPTTTYSYRIRSVR